MALEIPHVAITSIFLKITNKLQLTSTPVQWSILTGYADR